MRIPQQIRNEKPIYHFICEDTKSMRYYLEGFKEQYKSFAVIKSDNCGNKTYKEQVWNKAKLTKNKYEKIQKINYTIIACFDRDNDKIDNIKNILSKEEKHIKVIYNSPCYEYWLILHIEKIKPLFADSKSCIQRALQIINKQYNKNFDEASLKAYKDIFDLVGGDSGIKNAIQNANDLFKTKSDENYEGTFTNAHKVFEEIIDFRKNNERK